jgi:hypothetical protein
MKIKGFSIALATVVGLSSTSAEAFFSNPFKSKSAPASGQVMAHTERKGKIARGFRAFTQAITTACDSQKAGTQDGFFRCLQKAAGSNSIYLRSSILALDSNGNPIMKSVTRNRFKIDWFRQQLTLSMLTDGIWNGLSSTEKQIAEIESELQNSGQLSQSKQRGLQTKKEMLEEVLKDFTEALEDAWTQYASLQELMNLSPAYTPGSTVPYAPVPVPQATDSQFTTSASQTGPLMSSAFEAFLNKFALSNPSVMTNFCHNFLAIGKESGYEANYVRLADKGDISLKDVTSYQNSKYSIIAGRCSENSMRGILWRKLTALCPMEMKAEVLEACSGFTSAEVTDSQNGGQ